MPSDESFAALVSLACHDLRTPLATVHGFARTLERLDPLPERTLRYLQLISEASAEMAELLESLGLVARIERGSYEPALQEADSLELAQGAADRVRAGEAEARGTGAQVRAEPEWTERALAAFANCALRHGDAERVTLTVAGPEIRLSPVTQAGAVLLGEELRDLGAATARRFFEAVGGSVSLEGEDLVVRVPAT